MLFLYNDTNSTNAIPWFNVVDLYRLVSGRKGLVICAHTHILGNFPNDSWGTVLVSVLLIGSYVFLHFRVICSRII